MKPTAKDADYIPLTDEERQKLVPTDAEMVSLLRLEQKILVEAIREGIATLNQFVKLNRIPENSKGMREMKAALRYIGEAE